MTYFCFYALILSDQIWQVMLPNPVSAEAKIFIFQNFLEIEITVYHHIWIQHKKCIQMSTNKPSIGILVLEIYHIL